MVLISSFMTSGLAAPSRRGNTDARLPLSARWVLLLAIVLNGIASAQEATAMATSGVTSQDLAKSVHNPFEDFVKVPIEADTNLKLVRIITSGRA